MATFILPNVMIGSALQTSSARNRLKQSDISGRHPYAFALIKARRSPQPAKCYELVPIGADWTGNENVLG
jgi:hypothetical protein